MVGTRERIMTATAELFRRRGYNGTGLKDVTVAAEATVGSLYHFFPGGKISLAEAVLTESGAAYRALFELIADEHEGVADALVAFFDGAAEALEHGDFVDICPIGTVAGEIATTHDALRGACDRVFISWMDALAVRLERDLTPHDAHALATTIVAALLGALLIARCRRDAEPLRIAGQRMGEAVHAAIDAARARPGAPRRRSTPRW
jgi:AcrR family transcriptional regulator